MASKLLVGFQTESGPSTKKVTYSSMLGRGAFAIVYRAKCGELPCAAKILHSVFTEGPAFNVPTEKFYQECEYLKNIKHPNVVQYLGVCRDPETQQPVLLMEMMDQSLTHFLESSETPLRSHIEVGMCHDVALALEYLHSMNIVHRDLSSNNVLLIGPGSRAKVSDFGMSKMIDATKSRYTTPHTMVPGTPVYMPHEALVENSKCTDKLDVFSFGVLAVQIMTRKFPDPSSRTKKVEAQWSPTGFVTVPVLETECRKEHIDMIDKKNPLLSIALECLSLKMEDRPTSQMLCCLLEDIKEELPIAKFPAHAFSESCRCAELLAANRELKEKVKSLEKKMEANCSPKAAFDSPKSAIDSPKATVDSTKAAFDSPNSAVDSPKATVDSTKAAFDSPNSAVDSPKSAVDSPKATVDLSKAAFDSPKATVVSPKAAVDSSKADSEAKLDFDFVDLSLGSNSERLLQSSHTSNPFISFSQWRVGSPVPLAVSASSSAVVEGKMYCCINNQMFEYDVLSNSWMRCFRSMGFTSAFTSYESTIVAVTAKTIYSLCDGRWSYLGKTKLVPYAVFVHKGYLIAICRGQIEVYRYTGVRELPLQSCFAFTSPCLDYSSVGIHKGFMYFLAGRINKIRTQNVYRIPVDELLSKPSSEYSWFGQYTVKRLFPCEVAPLPVTRSICVTIENHLLSVGGLKNNRTCGDIYHYDDTSNKWVLVGSIPTPRYNSIVQFACGRLVVVGGWPSHVKMCNLVETAEVNL